MAFLEVPDLNHQKFRDNRMGKTWAVIRKRVQVARGRQLVRFSTSEGQIKANWWVAEIRQFCTSDETGESLMCSAMSLLRLSARGYHREISVDDCRIGGK